MGLFDMLKNIDKNAIDKLGKEVMDGIKNSVDSVKNYNMDTNNTSHEGGHKEEVRNNIPEEYQAFPTFDKQANEITCKEEAKYHRCTMRFYNATAQEITDYVAKIEALGYVKGSKVRYDKDNTYIIVDDDSSCDLELVFHIKR